MQRKLAVVAMMVAALGLVAVAAFVVVQTRTPAPTETPAAVAAEQARRTAEKAERAKVEVSGTEVVRRDHEGKIIWRVASAGTLEFDEQQRAARAEGVKWVLEKSGLGSLTLSAPLMEADYEGRRLVFSKGVAIESGKQDASFSAKRIEYQFDTEKLLGSGKVKFNRGKFTGTARELVIDNRAKKVRLKGGVRFTHTGVKMPG